MAEKNPLHMKTPTDYIYISNSESSDEEIDQRLCTSGEERIYGTIKGSSQATQAALSHTTAQCNPTVKRGPTHTPKLNHSPSRRQMTRQTLNQKISLNNS